LLGGHDSTIAAALREAPPLRSPRVSLPLEPPIKPQLARPRPALPEDEGWAYEPKYDGFRCIAFVDGADVHLQSRNGKPLNRYFPELAFEPGRYVLDGEIVVRDADGRENFDALGQRIHPAKSRVDMLAEQTPATLIAFDLLARDDEALLDLPFSARRAALEELVSAPVELTPCVGTPAEAEQWLQDAEGVIAKLTDSPYLPGERKGMVKVKRLRTLDAVVTGWRPGKEQGTVGALILALYTPDGALRDVGHVSGFKAAEKRSLVDFLAPHETGERGSAEPSRWTAGRDLEYVSLRPELVVEVTFDHTSAGRIRHGAKLKQWREDKDPRECTVDQLDQ
jgi:ATP-dependent DNA ligase